MTVRELYDLLGEVLRKHGNAEVGIVRQRLFRPDACYLLQTVRVMEDEYGDVFIALDRKTREQLL